MYGLRSSGSAAYLILILAIQGLAQRSPVEDAWNLLAKGQRQQAISLLHDMIRANPADADARLLLGSVLMEQGARAESILQLKEAVRLRPQSAEAQNALGEALNNFGDPKEARVPFEKAVQLDPGFGQTRVNLGLVLLEAGDFHAAAIQLDRAIELLDSKQDAAYPLYLRAKIYAQQSDFEKATKELQTAVSLQPDLAEAWSDLGQARKMLLDDTGALDAFERAVKLNPNDAVAQYRLGAECLQQNKLKDAIAHLEEAARKKPTDQSALNSLQMALRQDGRLEEAARIKAQLAQLLRDRDRATQNLLKAIEINNQGAQLEKAGKLNEALEKYKSALDLAPDHVGIRTNYAVALLHLGRFSEGIAQLQEAIRRDPDNQALKDALEKAQAQLAKRPGSE